MAAVAPHHVVAGIHRGRVQGLAQAYGEGLHRVVRGPPEAGSPATPVTLGGTTFTTSTSNRYRP